MGLNLRAKSVRVLSLRKWSFHPFTSCRMHFHPAIWTPSQAHDRGILARLKLPLGMNALLAFSAAPVVPTCKRAGVPRPADNLEMRRPARESVSAKLGRQVDHPPGFGPERHLCRLGSLPRGRLANLRHDGYVKEPRCLSAHPKSCRPPGAGSGNHGLGSLLGSVMANTPGCGGGHMPINDVIYTSGVLLSTFVCMSCS